MSSTDTGRLAEKQAAHYLSVRGFQIVDQNWRTPRCEIDIIACNQSVLYFVECKYRRTSNFGSGLAYITDRKLRQMHFAARIWVQVHAWRGEFRLSAIELTNEPPTVVTFIPSIEL